MTIMSAFQGMYLWNMINLYSKNFNNYIGQVKIASHRIIYESAINVDYIIQTYNF